MDQGHQHHIAALRPVASAAKRRAQVPLDHAEDRLYLPTLPIGLPVESFGHLSSVSSSGRVGRRPAVLGRDDRANSASLPREDMVTFRIVAGVGQERSDGDTTQRRAQRISKLVDVRAGATLQQRREDKMVVAIAHQPKLGKPRVGRCLPKPWDS